MSSQKWSGKSKRFNPSRNFVMSDSGSAPARKFNPHSSFQPNNFNPTANFQPGQFNGDLLAGVVPTAPHALQTTPAPPAPFFPNKPVTSTPIPSAPGSAPVPIPVLPTDLPPTDALAYVSLYHQPLRPLQYHTYAPTPFRKHMQHLEPHERHPSDLFVPEDIRKELADRNEATLQVLGATNLPEFVHVYHSLVPLDIGQGQKDEIFSPSSVKRYKAISNTNGRTYMLMRINDFQNQSDNENSLQVINKWKRVSSSAVVGVVEAFTTFAFSDSNSQQKSGSLVVVYEWWPLAKPLYNLKDSPVHILWSVAVQLFNGILAVHRRGLSCRGLVNEKFVLVNKHNRVRMGSLGALDIISKGVGPSLQDLQTQDFKDLGAMLSRLQPSHNDDEFLLFVKSLEEGNVERSNELLSPHVFQTADRAFQEVDHLESTLSLELENGRLFRLLSKLEYVLKYPQDYDPLSKNYPLTLFMKYVFGQQTEQGKPSLNLAHAITALNKLDAGVEDKVLLTSEDLKTRIVISYLELKQRFTAAFEALRKQ